MNSRIDIEIARAQKNDLTVDERLKQETPIRGVYGVFAKVGDESRCLFIGRSHNIAQKLFDHDGEITGYSNRQDLSLTAKLMREIQNATFEIKVLQVVNFEGDNYYRDMQRLAFAQSEWIEKYQVRGEALRQLPEGNWPPEETWNVRYKKR